MSIQWYPGHMTRARRELAALIPSTDVLLEVLDARMPAASENPVVAELRGRKPCIKILSKSDLADPAATEAWRAHFEERRPSGGAVLTLTSTTERPGEVRRQIPELCRKLGLVSTKTKAVRALIVGIPNVGKSTLINTLVQRPVAKVGDKPAVTKAQQQVILPSGMVLWDSPGILWPKIEDEAAALRLALGGSIPDTAIDYLNVAMFGAALLLERYPDAPMTRYKLKTRPETAEGLLTAIGQRRGCLRAGGVVDLHKASGILVHEMRTGQLGRLSFELPQDLAPADQPAEPWSDEPWSDDGAPAGSWSADAPSAGPDRIEPEPPPGSQLPGSEAPGSEAPDSRPPDPDLE